MVKVEKQATLQGHKDCVYALTEHSKKNIFFSAGGDGYIIKWDLENTNSGQLIAKVKQSVYALAYWQNENILLIGENKEGLHAIDLDKKQEVNSLQLDGYSIFAIDIIDQLGIVACSQGAVFFIDLKNWQVLKKLQLSTESCRTITHNNQKNTIALGFSDNSIKIIDLKNLKLISNIQDAHQNSIFSLSYSKDNSKLLSAGRDAHLKVWNIKNHQCIQDIPAHLYAINSIAYSPSGKYFATSSMDKSIKIWDASQYKLLKVIDKGRHAGHGTSVNKLLWSPYLGKLISASDDASIAVWNIQFAKKNV